MQTAKRATKTGQVPDALILTRDNRLTGLLQEIEQALREETSSLALWRAQKSLRSLVDVSRNLALGAEAETPELERARNTRTRPRAWRLP